MGARKCSRHYLRRKNPVLSGCETQECNNTSAYQAAVNTFFQHVAADHVTRVVFDLQENGGGNSDVINAWYTNLAKYSGKFYVLINGGTFSSAVLSVNYSPPMELFSQASLAGSGNQVMVMW